MTAFANSLSGNGNTVREVLLTGFQRTSALFRLTAEVLLFSERKRKATSGNTLKEKILSSDWLT